MRRTSLPILFAAAAFLITCGRATHEAPELRSSSAAALACVDDVTLVDPSPIGPDATTGDRFGYSVAPVGNDVVVGAPFYSPTVGRTGAVHLFDGTTGALLSTVVDPENQLSDLFGQAVAGIDSNRFVVLATNGDHNHDGVHEGVAYVVDRTGTILVVVTGASGAQSLGGSITADADHFYIGNQSATVSGHANSGTVTEFDVNTGARLRTFFLPSPVGGEALGTSVALGPRYLFSGAPYYSANGEKPGRVFVFDRATGALVQSIAVNSPSSGITDYFGYAITALGDHVFATAPPKQYLFDGPSGVLLWSQQVDQANDTTPSVAQGDGLFFAGTPSVNNTGLFFAIDTAGRIAYDVFPVAPTSGEGYGFSIAAGPSRVYTGAPYRTVGGIGNSGAAYIVADNRAPYAVGGSVSITENLPVRIVPSISDPNGDPLTIRVTIAPARGTVVATNGAFVYTPVAGYTGPDSFKYVSNDGCHDSPEAQFTITVNQEIAPQAFAQTDVTNEDVPLPLTPSGSDANGDPITFAIVSAPAHGTLTGSLPNITYTPAANYNGADSFTFRTNDGQLDSSAATVSITVNAVNDAPVSAADAASGAEDTPIVRSAPGVLANDSDVDSASLTAALVGAPAHGALSLAADGSFTYTPAANYNGPDSFTYRASDGALSSAVATVALTITPVNDAPVASPDSYSTTEDAALAVPVAAGLLGNDTDVDSAGLTALLVSPPSHGTLSLDPTGSFSYSPAANYAGFDSFTYQANDGSLSSGSTTVTIDVLAVNDPPVAMADSYSGTEDAVVSANAASGVLANDTDVDSAGLTAVLVAPPAHGTLALSGDGSFTFTPVANFAGTDSFTYRATDGAANSADTSVTLSVQPVNDAPVANPDSYTVAQNASLSVPAAGVLQNDADVDSVITAVRVSGPAHGSLVLGADGSFLYTPASGYSGSDSFVYVANDGALDSNPTTVALTVTFVDQPPVAVNDSYAVTEDTPLSVAAGAGVLANDSDPDSPSLSASLVSPPANGTLAFSGDGSFIYSPNANFAGTDQFQYRADDGSASTAATVTLSVAPVDDAPVASPDSYATTEDMPLVVAAASGVLANDTDVDGGTLSAVLVTTPAHGTLSLGANGSFVYTPTANYNGNDSFTYKANDGTLDSATVTAAITIASLGDKPAVVADHYSTPEDTPLVVAAAGGVLANDVDVDGGQLAAALVDPPSYGTLTLAADGSFSYQPMADFSGTDVFTYQASDLTTSDPEVVYVTVGAVNDPPSTPVPLAPAGGDKVSKARLVFTWEPADDPDGDVVQYHLQVSDANGVEWETTTDGTALPLPSEATVSSGYLSWRVEALDPSGSTAGYSADSQFVLAGAPHGGCDTTGAGSLPGPGMLACLLLPLLAAARRRATGR